MINDTPIQAIPNTVDMRSNAATGKQVAGYKNPIITSIRPTSSSTLDSTFTDSAVDMDADTSTNPFCEPANVDEFLGGNVKQQSNDTAISGRKNMFANTVEDFQSQFESASSRESPAVDQNSSNIEAREALSRQESASEGLDVKRDEDAEIAEDEDDDEWIDEAELIAVRRELAATLRAMKLRQEEQLHLHQLTINKLEAVAQRYLAQEQQTEDLVREMGELRTENHELALENNQLRERLSYLEAETAQKDVAVHAMSSAVAGLEGWIESTHASRPQTPIPDKRPKRQRVVIRGKGRFRGRWFVDEDGDHAVAYSLADAAAESQELHDGVKAWLRGFRDVEEELKHHESPTRSRPQGRFRAHDAREEDDWGEFQSPESNRSDMR